MFVKYFDSLVPNLGLEVPSDLIKKTTKSTSPIQKMIDKFQNHPSMKVISEKCNKQFSFKNVTLEEVESEIKNLGPSKATLETDIPTKILRDNYNIISPFVHKFINNTINLSDFSQILKLAHITPAYKKDSRYDKKTIGQ